MKTSVKIIMIVSLLVIGFSIGWNSHKQLQTPIQQSKLDSLQRVIDSVSAEAYMWERIVDTYDIAIEQFKEDNPEQSDKLDDYFHNVE